MNYKSILQSMYPQKDGHTPQTEPMPGQIENNAGGYYYSIDDWQRLDRFLILGTDGGTYYVKGMQLTKQNVEIINKLLITDGLRVIQRVVEISTSGRAPKNDSALFVLALAASSALPEIRRAAFTALIKVARTGTHLLMFVDFVSHMRGWGRGLRNGINRWFLTLDSEKLALQAIKYYYRNKWSMRDVVRLAHPKSKKMKCSPIIHWIAHPDKEEAIIKAREISPLIKGKYLLKETQTISKAVNIIRNYRLPREAVPTDLLNHKQIWGVLLENMPFIAKIRNLAKMTQVGLLEPFSEATDKVAHDIIQEVKTSRIHPFQILLALRTYAQGHGELGSLSWKPLPKIIESLNTAFDLSFTQVEPTGKRILVGIDVSGSMSGSKCVGSKILSCTEAAVAMAVLFVRTEEKVHTMVFDTRVAEFPITPSERLDDVLNKIPSGGSTDLAAPIKYAIMNNLNVDAFVIITDNETWDGTTHPVQALNHYRTTINKDAKLVVLSTAANDGCIVDNNDPLSLGIAGFDAAVPQLVSDFIKSS